MTLDARLQVLNGASQGGGFADFFVLSGVDAFTFADDDIVVINISMTHLSNGNEGIFLSGNFSSSDICDTSNGGVSCQAPIVVPAAIWMFGSGLVMLMGRRYRKG